jgi:hypothetical protein
MQMSALGDQPMENRSELGSSRFEVLLLHFLGVAMRHC